MLTNNFQEKVYIYFEDDASSVQIGILNTCFFLNCVKCENKI